MMRRGDGALAPGKIHYMQKWRTLFDNVDEEYGKDICFANAGNSSWWVGGSGLNAAFANYIGGEGKLAQVNTDLSRRRGRENHSLISLNLKKMKSMLYTASPDFRTITCEGRFDKEKAKQQMIAFAKSLRSFIDTNEIKKICMVGFSTAIFNDNGGAPIYPVAEINQWFAEGFGNPEGLELYLTNPTMVSAFESRYSRDTKEVGAKGERVSIIGRVKSRYEALRDAPAATGGFGAPTAGAFAAAGFRSALGAPSLRRVTFPAGIASGSSAGAAGSFVAPVTSGALAGAGIGIGGAGARVDGHHDHDKLPIVDPNTKWNASQQEMTILLKHTPDKNPSEYITICKDFVFFDKKYSYSQFSQFDQVGGVGKMTFAPTSTVESERSKYAFSIAGDGDQYKILRDFKREVLRQDESEPESVAGVYASSRIAQALVVAQEKVKDTFGIEFNKNEIAQIITIARNCGGFSKKGDDVIAECLESVSDEYKVLDGKGKSTYLMAVRNFSAEFQKSVGEYLKTGNVAATNLDAGFRTKRMTMDHVACILSDDRELAFTSGATRGRAEAKDMDSKVKQVLAKFPSPDFAATFRARLGPGIFR